MLVRAKLFNYLPKIIDFFSFVGVMYPYQSFGSSRINPGAVFFRIFTVAFLLRGQFSITLTIN